MLSEEKKEYLYKDKNGLRYIQGKAIRDNTNFKGWEIIPLWERLNTLMKKEKKIEQLKSDKQNLIEKLEKILGKYEHEIASEESAINLYTEIKEIAKGENNV